MYDLADVRPEADLDPGTNVLITGPPLSDKRDLAMDVLARGTTRGDGTIIVTTEDSGEDVLDDYEMLTGMTDPNDPVGIVDCVSKQRGVGSVSQDTRIKFASSPVDMTGIGIQLSEFLQDFYDDRSLEQNRILFDSVSTLLMYSDVQTVFRFLHVFTGRVQSADALGLYIVDSTSHDEQTINTIRQLFDVIVTVTEGDATDPEVSMVGAP